MSEPFDLDDDVVDALNALTVEEKEMYSILIADNLPDPPVDTPGRWVSPSEFRGRKSFGYFRCTCGKWWMSAHAFPQYKQACKGCNVWSLPVWLWRNDQRKDRSEAVEVINHRGPHDQQRCAACIAGECDVR